MNFSYTNNIDVVGLYFDLHKLPSFECYDFNE